MKYIIGWVVSVKFSQLREVLGYIDLLTVQLMLQGLRSGLDYVPRDRSVDLLATTSPVSYRVIPDWGRGRVWSTRPAICPRGLGSYNICKYIYTYYVLGVRAPSK